MNQPKFVVYDKSETILDSWAKDAVTFGFLFLCIYASRDNTWWTFITGSMFILFLASKAIAVNKRTKKCNSKEELKAWVESLDECPTPNKS